MINATVKGIPDMRQQLAAVPEKLRKRALRTALAAGARVVRDEARRLAPVLSASNALLAPFRKPGTLKKAINVRTSKRARRAGDVGVFVNVRPAKKGLRGARSKDDPFYWRFLEFGWTPATGKRGAAGRRQRRADLKSGAPRRIPGARFLQDGSKKLADALRVFIAKIGPAIDKLNRRQTP